MLLVCLYLLCKNCVQRRLFHTWVWIKCCFHCAFILYNIWVFPQVKSSDLCNCTSSITWQYVYKWYSLDKIFLHCQIILTQGKHQEKRYHQESHVFREHPFPPLVPCGWAAVQTGFSVLLRSADPQQHIRYPPSSYSLHKTLVRSFLGKLIRKVHPQKSQADPQQHIGCSPPICCINVKDCYEQWAKVCWYWLLNSHASGWQFWLPFFEISKPLGGLFNRNTKCLDDCPYSNDSAMIVDRPTQLICIWISFLPAMSTYKYKRHSRAIC